MHSVWYSFDSRRHFYPIIFRRLEWLQYDVVIRLVGLSCSTIYTFSPTPSMVAIIDFIKMSRCVRKRTSLSTYIRTQSKKNYHPRLNRLESRLSNSLQYSTSFTQDANAFKTDYEHKIIRLLISLILWSSLLCLSLCMQLCVCVFVCF